MKYINKIPAMKIWSIIALSYFSIATLIGYSFMYKNFTINDYVMAYIYIFIVMIAMAISLILPLLYLKKSINYKSMLVTIVTGPFVFIGSSSLSLYIPIFKEIEMSIYVILAISYLIIKLNELRMKRKLEKE